MDEGDRGSVDEDIVEFVLRVDKESGLIIHHVVRGNLNGNVGAWSSLVGTSQVMSKLCSPEIQEITIFESGEAIAYGTGVERIIPRKCVRDEGNSPTDC